MTPARATFKQIDLTRAVRGVENGGMRVGRVEIDPNGKIIILSERAAEAYVEPNEWDEVLKR